MSTNKDALLRYLLIDSRLRKEPYPGLETLKDYLQKEFGAITSEKMLFTKLTIKKDLKDMRKIYHAPVSFSFHENHYHYTDNQYTFLGLPQSILERLICSLKLLYLMGGQSNQPLPVSFEDLNPSKGYAYLPILVKGLSEKMVISFKYKSVNSKRSRDYIVHPHLIKEYKGTFYLIALKDKEKELRPFDVSCIIETPVVMEKDAELLKDFKYEPFVAAFDSFIDGADATQTA